MKLIKIRIGDVISIVDEKNRDDCDYPFYGININKEFMPSVANTDNVDRRKYKVVRKNRFVFSGMQTGRDNCIRISIYTKDEPILVSPAYITFEINSNLILPIYFFMFFNSKEKDRYGAFLSDSSVRSNLDWDRFCDIELDIPPIDIQKKYVDIYEGMIANLNSYESGLDDLKLVCDGYIENLRRDTLSVEIGKYIEEKKIINREYKIDRMYGLTNDLGFQKPNTMSEGSDIGRYKCVSYNDIVYPPPHFGEIGTIDIFKYEEGVVSPMYVVFSVKDEGKLNSDYLIIWLKRKEFMRYAFFSACDSIRDTFDFGKLCEYKIPIPNINVQKSIADIYKAYIERKKINERLKEQIKDLCPILIKGSIEESK